ncbi:MAG: GIY-YIG nuclease family protein [Bacteroidetes bacterium]|nr:GIY-YIG nuclease family protein [Bacteroidota bacterium]
MFTVYILFSEQINRYYIGFTGESAQHRLQKHLANHTGFTSKANDWKIVYTEIFNDKLQAMQRERQLKAWKNRVKIEELIKRNSTE